MSYDALATGLEYPDRAEVRALLRPHEGFGSLSATEIEELYTRTFDINPVCSLEVGWHLYGEDYNRGTFLVAMRGLMRSLGVEEGSELPDHLGSVLRVLGRMEPGQATPFAREYVLPAIGRMLEGFGEAPNPYRAVLEQVDAFLRERHGEPVKWEGPPETQPYPCGGCHGPA